MWKRISTYISFERNYGDASPKLVAKLKLFVEESFKLVEYILLLGILAFLAKISDSLALISITILLGLALSTHVIFTCTGFQFIKHDHPKNKWIGVILYVLTFIIVYSAINVINQAIFEVIKLMSQGNGI